MTQINELNFAESITDYKIHPDQYSGYVRRYKNILEIYGKDLLPIAVINKFGVVLKLTIDDGKKNYHFAFNDDPIFKSLGGIVTPDNIRKISLSRKEQYINTIPDGGIFSAYPNHEYRFG